MQLHCSRLPWQHRGHNATALPCSRLPWQHRCRNAIALPCSRLPGAAQTNATALPAAECRQHRAAMQLHCHAADCHGSTDAAMRLHCHKPTAMAAPGRNATALSRSRLPGSTDAAMRLHCHAADCHGNTEAAIRAMQPTARQHDAAMQHQPTAWQHRGRATALPCSRLPWQHHSAMRLHCTAADARAAPSRSATALPCSRLPWQHREPQCDCHASRLPGSRCRNATALRPTAMAVPRPQCNCTAMQPTAMAAPMPQCDCTAMQPLPGQHLGQCDCTAAADCHGSTEQCNCTAMQPTAMAAPMPQCDCSSRLPWQHRSAMQLRCHAADCHGSRP